MPESVTPKFPIHSVHIRRGQFGRWVPVPADAPRTFGDINPAHFALSGVLDPILEAHRDFKNQRYAQKRRDANYKGPVIVAEGDSWFEYPYNDDLIMVLGEKYAIMSLAKAGDAWADIYRKSELFPAINSERPDIVLLSIGGNDVMGEIENYIHPFELNRTAEQYILPSFDELVKWIGRQYDAMFRQILAQGAQVIVHGYDYPDPREVAEQGAQWIGPPLKTMRNIDGLGIWREIANLMITAYNDMLAQLVKNPDYGGQVHYVNLRGTIGSTDILTGPDRDLWNDEIHGTAAGFRKLAAKIDKAIKKAVATS